MTFFIICYMAVMAVTMIISAKAFARPGNKNDKLLMISVSLDLVMLIGSIALEDGVLIVISIISLLVDLYILKVRV